MKPKLARATRTRKVEAPPPPPPPPPPEPVAPASATPAEAPSPLAWVLVRGTRGRIHLAALLEYTVSKAKRCRNPNRAKIEVWEHKPFTDDDGTFGRAKTVAASEILPAPPADDDRRLKAARSLWERRKPLMERRKPLMERK